jgi:hypothetical protein
MGPMPELTISYNSPYFLKYVTHLSYPYKLQREMGGVGKICPVG